MVKKIISKEKVIGFGYDKRKHCYTVEYNKNGVSHMAALKMNIFDVSIGDTVKVIKGGDIAYKGYSEIAVKIV